MQTIDPLRRGAAFAVALAAAATLSALGSSQALAQTLTPVYASGAALQSQLQNNILIPNFASTKWITFTSTTSGAGSAEFGNTGAGLAPTQDTGAPSGTLDAYVATDNPPTTGELSNAQTAAGTKATSEITVPVAQTPLDLLLSLPTKLSLSSGVQLPNVLTSQLLAGTVPSTASPTKYAANTWGALLADAGSSFTDSGGGGTPVTVEVRKNGAGTTLNLKQYLTQIDSKTWSSFDSSNSYPVSENWPGSSTKYLPATKGNGTDEEEALAVLGSSGSVGYATAGDAASTGFTNTPTSTPLTKGAIGQQILYAQLQDNGLATKGAKFADPESGTKANVYTGANVNVNGSGGGGEWIVPVTTKGGSVVVPSGSWAPTQASDPNILGDSGSATYPLVAVAYDLSWSLFNTGNLASLFPSPATPQTAQTTAQQFLQFATTKAGQNDILNSGTNYYAPLPTGGTGAANIQADAALAAAGV
jgi:hypothetical protein